MSPPPHHRLEEHKLPAGRFDELYDMPRASDSEARGARLGEGGKGTFDTCYYDRVRFRADIRMGCVLRSCCCFLHLRSLYFGRISSSARSRLSSSVYLPVSPRRAKIDSLAQHDSTLRHLDPTTPRHLPYQEASFPNPRTGSPRRIARAGRVQQTWPRAMAAESHSHPNLPAWTARLSTLRARLQLDRRRGLQSQQYAAAASRYLARVEPTERAPAFGYASQIALSRRHPLCSASVVSRTPHFNCRSLSGPNRRASRTNSDLTSGSVAARLSLTALGVAAPFCQRLRNLHLRTWRSFARDPEVRCFCIVPQ